MWVPGSKSLEAKAVTKRDVTLFKFSQSPQNNKGLARMNKDYTVGNAVQVCWGVAGCPTFLIDFAAEAFL